MFELKNASSNHPTITICRRFVKCNEITFDDFYDMIISDFAEAITSFDEIVIPHMREARIARWSTYLQNTINNTIECGRKYAENRWKTEKRRQLYMDTEVASKIDKLNELYKGKGVINDYDHLMYFDFDGNCGTSMGINGDCILSVEDVFNETISNNYLNKCFNALKNSKYFNNAIGWEFTYEGNSEWGSSFRPAIKLLFDKNITEEIEKSKEALSNAVSNFYSGTHYFGD